VIVNDHTDRDLHGRYEWRVFGAAGEAVASGDGAADVACGEIAHLPFSFAAPPAAARTDLTLELKVTEANQTVAEDAFELQVYPRPAGALSIRPVALLDAAEGHTGPALEAAGVPFERVTSAAELALRGRR
jgi:hypothetical protein